MKTTHAGLIGVATIVLAAGGIFLVGKRAPQKPKPTASASAAELSEVKEELAQLRSRVALSNVIANGQALAPSPGTAESQPPPSGSGSTAEENNRPAGAKPTPGQPSIQEISDTRLQVFNNEPIDAVWQREAEVVALRQISSGLPAGATAGRLECRSTMCRVEVSYKDVESYKEYLKTSITNADRPWKGGVMGGLIEKNADGSVRAEHYYVRPGSDPMAQVIAQYQSEHEGT